jgi:2',3'-cyclic-nucleotide 2'-phosphodiesterase (5'-nucleotidase family)
MKNDGADIIIALTHVPDGTLVSLASDVSDLGISLFLGGHNHNRRIEYVGSSLIVESGAKGNYYGKIDFIVNKTTKQVIFMSATNKENTEGAVTPNTVIQGIVDDWDDLINASEVISYTSRDLFDQSIDSEIGKLVTYGFIDYFDYSYNIGVTNRGGGFRDYFREGDISIADVVSVIPFENNLLAFNMTGQDIKDWVQDTQGSLVFSGVRYDNQYTNFEIQENGVFNAIDTTKLYSGLITDYSWYVSYQNQFDAIDTGVHYRDTVLNYFPKIADLAQHDPFPQSIPEFSLNNIVITYYLLTVIIVCQIIIRRNKRKRNR